MVESMNIAIVIDSLGGGGAERVMLDLAKGFISRGHNAHYICLESRQDHCVEEGIPIHVLYDDRDLKSIVKGRSCLMAAAKLKALVHRIEKEFGEFDLFLSNLDPTNAVISNCNFDNVRYVLHNSMEEEIRRERKLGPIKFFRKVKAKKIMNGKDLVAVSNGVAKEALEYGLIKPNKITTIYNPCDLQKIEKLSFADSSHIPDYPYILHVGRVVKQKRHDTLFKALSMIPDRLMVCLCKDVAKAKKIAKKYGVEDRVLFPGFTNNPYVWMRHASVLVLSSDFEGLGMVLIEALKCGTPVVSTDCQYGPSEILTGELSRYLSPIGDSKALALNISDALVSYPSIDRLPIFDEVSMDVAVDNYIRLAV